MAARKPKTITPVEKPKITQLEYYQQFVSNVNYSIDNLNKKADSFKEAFDNAFKNNSLDYFVKWSTLPMAVNCLKIREFNSIAEHLANMNDEDAITQEWAYNYHNYFKTQLINFYFSNSTSNSHRLVDNEAKHEVFKDLETFLSCYVRNIPTD